MFKLQTIIQIDPSKVKITYSDKIMVLGSCFADSVGRKLQQAGLDVYINPFGTLYNPRSIYRSIRLLETGSLLTEADCIQMGSGSNLFCSFFHHTSFARPTAEEFLANANAKLREASEFYHQCNKVIITFGTAWVYNFNGAEDYMGTTHLGQTVSNCLKRNAKEFTRERLTVSEITKLFSSIISPATATKDKEFIFTVSPIRHFKDGAHGNQISKSTLILGIEDLLNTEDGKRRCDYFPSYEIVLDELRDYRFYAEDMIHPTDQTVSYIWERFCDFAIPKTEHQKIAENEKAWRQSQHRKVLFD
jgi:hypothetical protein